jgi:hypothetical protein
MDSNAASGKQSLPITVLPSAIKRSCAGPAPALMACLPAYRGLSISCRPMQRSSRSRPAQTGKNAKHSQADCPTCKSSNSTTTGSLDWTERVDRGSWSFRPRPRYLHPGPTRRNFIWCSNTHWHGRTWAPSSSACQHLFATDAAIHYNLVLLLLRPNCTTESVSHRSSNNQSILPNLRQNPLHRRRAHRSLSRRSCNTSAVHVLSY